MSVACAACIALNIGAGFGVAVDEFEAVAGGGGLPGFLLSTC